jgi:small conductance mechanosensitive channel
VTIDGTMLAVPNSVIINSTVSSYTNFPHIRLDINITIGLSEDIDETREVLLGIVANDPEILENPVPKEVMTAINDYNVALQLQAWLKDEEEHIPKRFELREKVYKTLTQAGIEMPLEKIQLAPFEISKFE